MAGMRRSVWKPQNTYASIRRMMKKALFKKIALVGLAAAALSTACRDKAAKPVTSVLLITVDSLRADHIGCYGGKSGATAAVDQMAASGARFTSAHANAVQTLPSHASILSGLYASTHGVLDNSGFRFPGNNDTAATLLKAQGFSCAAFVGSSRLDSRYGLTSGFDLYDDEHGDATQVQDLKVVERSAETVADSFLKWVDTKQVGGKWFAWVHFNDPHEPNASRPYDGEIGAVDAQIARVTAHLKEKGWSDSTCVILTADHGEGLGDHGESTHGVFAYESTLRVPLIVTAPGISAKSIDTPAQHIDILPTIVDMAGIAVPAGLKGMSLKSVLYGKGEAPAPRDLYFEAMSASQDRHGAPLTGLISGKHKYIELPIPELYDIEKDPTEDENLAEKHPQVAADLKQRLTAISEAAGAAAGGGGQSAEEMERLESLGYVSGGSEATEETAVTYTADDDPKHTIALDATLQEGVTAARAGDLAHAQQLFSEIISKRPAMSVAYGHLATVYRQMGQPKKGVEILEKALKEGHGMPGMLGKLGLCFLESGDTKRAIEVLEQAIRESDDTIDAQMYLAAAYTKAGLPDRAAAAYQNVLTDDPGNASAQAGLGR